MRTPLALLVLMFTCLVSTRAVEIPSGGTPLFSGSPPSGFAFYGPNSSRTTVPVTGIPPTQGWRIATLADAVNRWDIELASGINRAVAAGDVGLVQFWARTISSPKDPLGYAKIAAVVQKNSANYDKSLQVEFFVSKEWKEYVIPFSWAAAYAANGSALVFDFGYTQQEIEIAGIQLYYYGTSRTLDSLPKTSFGYPGDEDNAAWRTAALARIDSIRKGDLSVTVRDESGNPVPGVSVNVEMVRHDFQWGTALDFSRLLSDTAENRWYKRTFFDLFNAASPENDLKWQPLAGDWGASWTLARAVRGLRFLNDHGIPVRGHVMVWPGTRNLPRTIVNLLGTASQSTIPQLVLDHIDEVANATKGLVEEWDVQNEPFDNKDLLVAFGDAIAADWFKRARAKLPGVRLYLNDYNNENMYKSSGHFNRDISVIRTIKANGGPIDAMGIQAHIGASPTPPQYYLDTLDAFAAEGLKLRVTEYDMDTTDEAEQAKYTRDFMIASFSHPEMLGFQFWGFWEKAHWIPEGAMFRTDFSEKPMATVVRQLLQDEWRTRYTAATNASGVVSTRGFYGEYIATIDYNGKRIQRKFSHTAAAPAAVEMTVTPPRLYNLSTRGLAGGTKGSLTVGLFIDGTESKRILIRASGPTLTTLGVPSALTSTSLKVYKLNDPAPATLVASNSGWTNGNDAAAFSQIFVQAGAFGFNANSLDSAVVVTLTPGRYTAVCESPDGREGVGLVEAYELEKNSSVLYNLSTLGYTEEGVGALTSGLVVDGRNARTYLIRAVGPTLSNFNVTGLARPTLTLYRGDVPIAANQGWQASADRDRLKTVAAAVGAFALNDNSADAAMLVTLEPNPPRHYTVQASGADGTKGNVLLEIYEVRQ